MNDPLKQFLDSLSKEQLRAWQDMQEEDEDGVWSLLSGICCGCAVVLVLACIKWILS